MAKTYGINKIVTQYNVYKRILFQEFSIFMQNFSLIIINILIVVIIKSPRGFC